MASTPAKSAAKPLIAPTVETWRAMTPEARLRFQVEVIDALSDPQSAMSEGMPHKKAKGRAIDLLGLHFRSIGRVIFLAEDLPVLYPGEETFSPDILAVTDVPQVEDDERMAWVVADEGKGLDFVLEVLHKGDRTKDLVDNVERYARLGIPEYFVYDRGRQHIHGYRLPASGARRYQRIVPQLGRYTSAVLGLDFALQDGRLVVFHGMAELFGTNDLIGRLKGMMARLEDKSNAAEEQAQQALSVVREGILALLQSRGLPCPEDLRARVLSCEDPATLQRWLLRSMTVATAAEALSNE